MDGLAARLLRAVRRAAVLPLLLLSARYHLSRSDFRRAKEVLLRAVRLAPRSFRAHLSLGALYLEENDFFHARREFLAARELNPGRFRRRYPVITGGSGDVNINLFYFPGFTDCEAAGEAPGDFLREFIGAPLREEEAAKFGLGDFSSYREFRKFREMGPIPPEEAESVDWDEVLSRFLEEE